MKVNRKGVVLIIALMIMAVLLVLTGVYFSGLLTEKRSADTEKFVLQALGLAEAGANHALAELRKRIRIDLGQKLSESTVTSSTIAAYVTGNHPLEFLYDYAYADGGPQFSVSANEATLEITPLTLNTAVQGTYAETTITITSAAAPIILETDVYRFYYNYSLAASGMVTAVSPGIIKEVSLLGGSFTITVQRGNFAKYALFTNHHRTPSGTIVWFTANTNFNGPVHSNENTNDVGFSFANNPSGHFTEAVTQVAHKARFYNNGSYRTDDADAYPVGCTDNCTDKPIFDVGFTRGVSPIALPTLVTEAQMKSKATAGTNPSNGIWLPQDGSGNLTGGIYIKGSTSSSSDNRNIIMSVDANARPVYTIKQGTTTQKIITVDYANNQTIVAGSGTGTAAGTYTGVPTGTDHKGIIIYSNDDIAGFSGTVQKDTKITVASEKDLIITNNVVYEKDPRIEGNESYQNMAGILSWNGNVRIGTAAPSDINIHGIVMAPNPTGISGKGIFTVDNYDSGNPRGTATLLGGVISDYYGAFGTFSGSQPVSGYGRNFVYDTRMLEGMSPPYFPTTTNFDSTEEDSDGDGIKDLDERLIWQDQGV